MPAVIFDYIRTIYDPATDQLMKNASHVLDVLREKGVTLFLIAKGDEERKKRIEQLGLPPYFKRVIVNQNKSAEDYASCIAACPKGTKFYAVGDRVREEIRHGNACGITTIWFHSGKFENEEPENATQEPSFTVTSLREILPLILQ